MVGIVQVLCLLSLIARKQVKVSYDLHTFLQRKNVDGRCEVGMKSNFLEFIPTSWNSMRRFSIKLIFVDQLIETRI